MKFPRSSPGNPPFFPAFAVRGLLRIIVCSAMQSFTHEVRKNAHRPKL